MTEMLTPFSPGALASLPKDLTTRPRYTRADGIPEAEADDEGNMPAIRDYHAINSLPPQVRIPKKIATPIRVEAKVWFANERSKPSRDLGKRKGVPVKGLTKLLINMSSIFLSLGFVS